VSTEHVWCTRSCTQRGLQTHGVTGPTLPDASHYKRSGAPDASHCMHPKRLVPLDRVTHRGQVAPDAPARFNPRPVQSVWCLTLTQSGTDNTPDAQAQRPVPLRPASGERETLSQLLQTSHRCNRKYTLYFLKSVESR